MLTLLIDSNNMAYRARYAYNLSHQGQDVSVLYGTMRMIMSLIKRFKPASVICCWDAGIPGFRKRLVPEYKRHRKKDDDLAYHMFKAQLKMLHAMLPEFGILSVRRKGLEADDLLYHASKMVDTSIIVTSDTDLLQAVDECTSVLRPGKNEVLHTLENMDIAPDRYVEWKALQGDSSDGIPGIPGVGPKTATKIMNGEELSDRLENKLNYAYAEDTFWDRYYCMDLSQDRSGARYVLLNTPWNSFQKVACTQWCIDYSFTSLLEKTSLGMIFGKLERPKFDVNDMAIPRIWDYGRDNG